jgi:hypothetical protein
VKIDINSELRDFTYITNLYKFIEGYNIMGHQMGRKVGDMLEILTMGAIYRNKELLKRLDTEGKLDGYTTAGHKVEFAFYNDLKNLKGLFGFIECKCVGVEVTKSGKNNTHLRHLSCDEYFEISFSNHWLAENIKCIFKLAKYDDDSATLSITYNSKSTDVLMNIGNTIKVALDEDGDVHIVAPGADMYKQIPKIIRVCKVIELAKIENNKVTLALFDCLTGPQTIEKAKQASLVAMDIRRKIDGHWGKEDIPEDKKTIISILVLCEFSHWEVKSRNVIKTCIDHNLIMPDVVLVKAFQEFETTFGVEKMLDQINKKDFHKKKQIQDAVNRVLDYFDGYVFYDIELNKFVDFTYENNKLVIKEKE